jgi:aryl carrier-like protein
MSEFDVRQKTLEVIADELGPTALTPDMRLIEDLALDSLDAIRWSALWKRLSESRSPMTTHRSF